MIKKYGGYVLTVILSMIVGITGTYFIMKNNIKNTEVTKTISEVSITEENTIKSSIDKIYKATVLIESYQRGKVAGSGSGFIYKQDDKSGRVDYRRAEHCLTTARRPHGGEKESRIYREDETTLVFSCKIQRRRQAYEKHHTHSVPHTPAESQLFSVEVSVYEQLFARQIL